MVVELKNEVEIVKQCQEGELRAYEAIYRHYEQPLFNFGLRMLGRQQDVEDAVQVVFLKLYRGIGRFNFQAKFSTYLFRIMLNVCFDMLNKRKRIAEQSIEGFDLKYSSKVELRVQLEEAIQSLPEKMRACFVLFAVQGVKQNEIAEILNMKIGTVKATIFQAKAKLRGHLADNPGVQK